MEKGMEESKTHYFFISIVAIVAVVGIIGIVISMTGNGSSRAFTSLPTIDESSGDIVGEAKATRSIIPDKERKERPEFSCGDGLCRFDESCSSCPADCGKCPPLTPLTNFKVVTTPSRSNETDWRNTRVDGGTRVSFDSNPNANMYKIYVYDHDQPKEWVITSVTQETGELGWYFRHSPSYSIPTPNFVLKGGRTYSFSASYFSASYASNTGVESPRTATQTVTIPTV